jgi:hypothetical protein
VSGLQGTRYKTREAVSRRGVGLGCMAVCMTVRGSGTVGVRERGD